MSNAAEHRARNSRVITVNEAAYAAGVSLKTVNQAIDREHVQARDLKRPTDRSRRGIDVTDAVYLSVRSVLAPAVRAKLYRFLHGKPLSELPLQFEAERVVLNLEPAIREVRERLELLDRIAARVEVDPEVRGGEPVFRGTRTPVYAIARKLVLGSTQEELYEDYPRLEQGDPELAAGYARLYPPRGRPRSEQARPTKQRGAGGAS
jgi:uncharacterized protein (DUF433 family)